jgi:hypothetical protein
VRFQEALGKKPRMRSAGEVGRRVRPFVSVRGRPEGNQEVIAMAHELGICVATDSHLAHVIGLSTAARAAGKDVEIFFTGEGVHLTQDPRFSQLLGVARVKVCEVSYIANGYKGKELPGLKDKDFVTQARNAEMVEECQRYVVL